MLTLWLATGVLAKTALAPGAIAGQTSLTFTTTAGLDTSAELTGQSALTFTTTADLTGSGSAGANIEGSTSLTFTPAATALGGGLVSAATSLTFTPAGDLTGSGSAGADISGSTSLTFDAFALLAGTTNIEGSTSLTFSVSEQPEQLNDASRRGDGYSVQRSSRKPRQTIVEIYEEQIETIERAAKTARKRKPSPAVIEAAQEAIEWLTEARVAPIAVAGIERAVDALNAATLGRMAFAKALERHTETIRAEQKRKKRNEEAALVLLLAA